MAGSQIVNDVIINYKSVGLDKVGSEIKQTSVTLDGLVISSTGAEKAIGSLENRWGALNKTLGTTAGNAAHHAKNVTLSNNAVAAGAATQEEANEAIAKSAAKYSIATKATEAHANSSKLARYELINLSRQIQDVGVSLFSGQSPLTVAVQQGSQIADVFASSEATIGGAFRQMGSAALKFITPVNAGIAAVVGLTAAAAALAVQYDKVQVSSQRAISGAGERTGTTVSDLNKFTEQNSGLAGTGLSNKEARELGESFTATGEIVVSRLHGMSDAVVGFANQTGKSIGDAKKDMVDFATDPTRALDDLGKVFGTFDEKTRKAVETLVLAGDKTGAFQVEIDAIAEKSKKAAANMGFFEKAARGVVNALATETVKPSGVENQLEAARGKLNTAISSAPDMLNSKEASQNIERLSREFENLQAAREAAIGATAAAQLDNLSTESSRAREQVAAIAKSWGDVGTETALTLNALQQQVSIAGARTAQAQQAAQYEADLANEALKGKKEIEAQAIASAKRAVSEASATAAVEKQVDALKDQNAMIKAAQTGTEAQTSAAIAYKNAIESGADSTAAAALKAQTLANAIAQAGDYARTLDGNFKSMVNSLNNFNAGIGQSLASAMQSGTPAMSWQQAQSLGQQTFTNSAGQPLQSTFDPVIMPSGTLDYGANPLYPVTYRHGGGGQNISGNFSFAAWQMSAEGQKAINQKYPGLAGYPTAQEAQAAAAADYGAFLSAGSGGFANTILGSGGSINAAISGVMQSGMQDSTSTLSTLFQLKNSQTTDKNVQLANDQQFLSWLQSQPQTIANLQAISSLTKEMEDLRESTDGLNQTNQELLSPYYSQDPRTSHIGFRSQGMSTGGEFTVPGGYSANDNMLGTIPLASGEIVSVRRPGQGAGSTVNVVNHITVSGAADRGTINAIGRTVYQSTQSAAKSLRAATR